MNYNRIPVNLSFHIEITLNNVKTDQISKKKKRTEFLRTEKMEKIFITPGR